MAKKKEFAARGPMVEPSYPGLLLADILPEMDGGRRTIGEIAALLGVSRQTLHRVLAGSTPVTPEMAVRLGKLCGNGPGLWLRMQAAYDAWHAAQRLGKAINDIPTLS